MLHTHHGRERLSGALFLAAMVRVPLDIRGERAPRIEKLDDGRADVVLNLHHLDIRLEGRTESLAETERIEQLIRENQQQPFSAAARDYDDLAKSMPTWVAQHAAETRQLVAAQIQFEMKKRGGAPLDQAEANAIAAKVEGIRERSLDARFAVINQHWATAHPGHGINDCSTVLAQARLDIETAEAELEMEL